MRLELYEPGNTSRDNPPQPNIVIGHSAWRKRPILQRDSNASVIFVPCPPIGETEIALETANLVLPQTRRSSKRHRIIAITDLPDSAEQKINAMQHEPWSEHLLLVGTSQTPPLDIVFSRQERRLGPAMVSSDHLSDSIIFVRRGYREGGLIGETLRRSFGVKDLSIIPNTHIGFEKISAEVGQYFGLNYPPPETVRQLGIKSEFRKLQRSLGLRAPKQSPVIVTDTNGDEAEVLKQFGDTSIIIADTSRQAKAEILSQIEKVGSETKKGKVVIKAIDGFGSVSVRIIDRRLTLEEKEKLVEKHLSDRGGLGGTIVEEFMEGVEIGCHITTSGGKISIKYTRKTMAKGAKGDQSEEVEHIIDPNDPIFELCNQILTRQIMKVVETKGLQYYNASHNVDAMLDQCYFDGNKVKQRPPEITEDDNSHLVEWNAARKGGTALELLIAAATLESEYPQWELRANMGESDAIDAMKAATYKRAAIIQTDLWDFNGYAIDVREILPTLRYNPVRPSHIREDVFNSIFYSGLHTFDTTYKIPGVFDKIKRLLPVGDYITKGPRPVNGVWGKNISEAHHYLDFIRAMNGILVLRGGSLYKNHPNGGYEKVEVTPGSRLGNFLEEEIGLHYRKGRWRLAA